MEDSRLTRIEAKLDDTNDHLASMDVTLAMQAENLRYHMKRTSQLERELVPIRRFVYMAQGAIALAVALAGIMKAMGKI